MIRSFLFPLLFAPCAVQAQFHPDPFNDDQAVKGYRENAGQILGTNLQPAEDVDYRSEGSWLDIWLRQGSLVSFSNMKHDTLPTVPDSSFHVEMQAAGELAQLRDAEAYQQLPDVANYYHPDYVAENVHAYNRCVYWDIWPGISLQFYAGSSGPKMALVCEPGSDPEQILLEFTGQDSLGVDVNGFLKLYLEDKWIELREAVAYQVDADDNILPLLWGAEYNVVDDDGLVNFYFDAYDPALPLILLVGAPPTPSWDPPEPRNMGWSTYAGGNDADEFMANDVDNNGDPYACGYSYIGNFPIETGTQVYLAEDGMFSGSQDAVVMKFDHSNKQIIWATYLGGNASGSGTSEWMGMEKAFDIAAYKGADPDLEYVFVTGTTISTDFFTEAESGTPFSAADLTPLSGGVGNRHGAFLVAYTQFDGILHWSTTHGPVAGDAWVTDGLAVDVDADGVLAWGGSLSETPTDPGLMDYPYVTPAGAFTKANGGGFFVLFDGDYQIFWDTPFGAMGFESGVFDLKVSRVGSNKVAYLTGITSATTDPAAWPLDVFQPSGSTGYYQNTPGGGARDAYFSVLNLATYQIDYSTYWGGNGNDFGIALETFPVSPHGYIEAWIGGLSKSTDLGTVQLPDAGAVMHSGANAGGADGFILRWQTQPEFDLLYGTLYGGEGEDAVLDIEGGSGCNTTNQACQIYFSGETSSTDDVILSTSSVLYLQDELGNSPGSTWRDGFILALGWQALDPIWTTYLGGEHTDRGWGVAASEDELYVVGGTISDQETFPLKEWDLFSPLDWYDGDLLNNLGSGVIGTYSFLGGSEDFLDAFDGGASEPWPGLSHDAFIASFGVSTTLGVEETASETGMLTGTLIDPDGVWMLALPKKGDWTVGVFDATGRVIQRSKTINERQHLIDLRQRATGMYAVTCTDANGMVLTAKLLRP